MRACDRADAIATLFVTLAGSWCVMGWWVTDQLEYGGMVKLLSTVLWVLVSIVLHELGHGFMAIRCGDRTPIDTGHMTLNPAIHMGKIGLVLFALAGITFGAMPVNPRRFRGRYDDAKVALAGPAMNVVLVVFITALLAIWIAVASHVTGPVRENMVRFLTTGIELNIVLALFNLLPVPPLDGATVLSRFSTGYRRLFMSEQAQQMTIMLFLLVFIFLGGRMWRLAERATEAIFLTLVDLLA